MNIEIDSNELWKFRFNACDKQSDGNDRALWYDKKEKKFFQTCETKNAEYTFDNPNDIVLLIYVKGNNNSKGLYEICDGCSEECTCSKGDILYEVCFETIMDIWYPVMPINWGKNQLERELTFVEM